MTDFRISLNNDLDLIDNQGSEHKKIVICIS